MTDVEVRQALEALKEIVTDEFRQAARDVIEHCNTEHYGTTQGRLVGLHQMLAALDAAIAVMPSDPIDVRTMIG
jgi:hypothetical protein